MLCPTVSLAADALATGKGPFWRYEQCSFVDACIVASMQTEGLGYLYAFDDDFRLQGATTVTRATAHSSTASIARRPISTTSGSSSSARSRRSDCANHSQSSAGCSPGPGVISLLPTVP